MNFENQAPIRKTAEEKYQEKEAKFEKFLGIFFSEIFKSNNEPEKRFNDFLKRLNGFLVIADEGGLSQEEIDKVKNDFKSCCLLENEEEFVEKGLDSVKTLVEWRRDNEIFIEAKSRKNFVENSEYITLNESLCYGRGKDGIHIHVAPSETLSSGRKFVLLKDGLRKLQKIVKEDEEIKEVYASSWIVATEKGSEIMKKLGFTVVGEISSEMKEEFSETEKRPIAEAFIKRDDFLKEDLYK